jgi:hypothetical protein
MAELVKKYRVLIIGIVALSAGIPLWTIGLDLIKFQSACAYAGGKWPPGNDFFPPNTTVTATCNVTRESGQDLTLWAQFNDYGIGETIPIPVRVEIRDPNNVVLVDKEFNIERIILYVKPQLFGNYTATISSLEDPDNRLPTGSPKVHYAFGYLTSNGYEGVENPVGTAVGAMLVVGNGAMMAGFILIVIAVVQKARKKRNTIGPSHRTPDA